MNDALAELAGGTGNEKSAAHVFILV